MKYYSIVLILSLFWISCERESATPDPVTSLGLDYFPLEVNSYKIYDVKEVEYTILGETNSNYQLMAETGFVFKNDIGEDIYSINRYIRTDESEQWELATVWSAQRDNYKVIVTEENVTYQKLSFPIHSEVIWDGNAFNSEYEELYNYESVGRSFTTDNNQLYENTVIVVHNDLLDTIVEYDYRIEAYAQGIGLVHKEINHLNWCTDIKTPCPGQQIIETGFIYRQSLIEYSQN